MKKPPDMFLLREFRFLFFSYSEGIGPKADRYELLEIVSDDERHFIQIKNQKDLDKAIKLAVNTSIGKLINWAYQTIINTPDCALRVRNKY